MMGVHMSDMLVHIWLVDEAVCMSLDSKQKCCDHQICVLDIVQGD